LPLPLWLADLLRQPELLTDLQRVATQCLRALPSVDR